MSTNGAIGVIVDGKLKVSYNHSDSYPDYLGEQIVDFCNHISKENGWVKFKDLCKNVKLVKETSQPTEEDIQKYSRYFNGNLSRETPKDWYCLLREVQGVQYLKEIYDENLDVILDGKRFLKDSLFCEYAYILNLDTQEILFFDGGNTYFQKDNPLNEYFDEPYQEYETYQLIKCVGKFPFNDIPSNWMEVCYSNE